MKSGVGQEKQITFNSHGTNLKQGLTLLNEEQFDEIMLYLQLTTTQIRFKLSLDQFGEFFLSLQLGTAIYKVINCQNQISQSLQRFIYLV